MDHLIKRVIETNKHDVIRWAETNNNNIIRRISDIPDGVSFYEVNLNNNMLGEKRQKNVNSTAESTKPWFIISDDNLKPHSILMNLEPVAGSKRKRKSKKNHRKSKKNHRKSKKW